MCAPTCRRSAGWRSTTCSPAATASSPSPPSPAIPTRPTPAPWPTRPAGAASRSLPIPCPGARSAAIRSGRWRSSPPGWLAGLPRPIGLLCHAGGQALSAAAACRSAGLAIPDDVGLLTSDDEPLGNLLAAVPLSAVGKPEALVGERLAERLALRLAGRDPGPPEVLAPTGIIARASTELGRLGDPLVVAALAWIAANLAKPIGVDAVAAATGVSRRALERHFRDLGRTTVLAEIQRLRVARALVLVEGGATVAAAAAAAGMSPSALYKRFQRQYHGSPAAWAEGVRAPAR
jgi:LacI family transcriptional regulator